MSTSPVLDVAVPVYNEERELRGKIHELTAFLTAAPLPPWRVTIADNGSTDATAQLARELADEDARVRLVRVGRKGVGLALKTAWAASPAPYVACMDLDLSTDLRHVPEAWTLLEQGTADLVNGSRLLPGARVVGRSLLRGFTSRAFNAALKTALGVRFTDGMCGFQFMKKEVFTLLTARGLANDGWFFSAELLVRAEWNQMHLREIPVSWTDDKESKVKVIPLACHYLRAIAVLAWEKRLRKTIRNRPERI